MRFHDGKGRYGAEIEQAAKRPDLAPCARCDSGTKCNCEVYGYGGLCSCMGFLSCPECPRECSGFIVAGFQQDAPAPE